jgi:class 3 adenylate cyclase
MALPSGLVTFVFTEIESSTRLAQVAGAGYPAVLQQHRSLLRGVLRLHHGVEVSSFGESSFLAFPDAGEALRACRTAQRTLAAERWPAPYARPRVRIGLHSGYARPRGGEYASPEVHRAARIAAAAHGGQVLCSAGTARAAAPLPDHLALWDLGLYRLRGFDGRERLFQLIAPDWRRRFPRPRAEPAAPHNLPAAATSFVGRRTERARLARLLAEHRLVTLAGPAGAGKSRLAVQVAGERAGAYPDGVWYVDLADGGAAGPPDGDPLARLVSLGLGGIAARPPEGAAPAGRMLLVLDGCDRRRDRVAAAVVRLLAGDPGLRVLATGRAPIGVPGELVWDLPPLSLRPAPDGGPSDAVALLADRVAAARGATPVPPAELPGLARLAVRLGGFPLALEQAAARLRALTAGQLAERLAGTGARIDRPEPDPGRRSARGRLAVQHI